MDQRTLAESESFVAAVKATPGSFLQAQGFRFEAVRTSDDALQTTVIFTSPSTSIAIYHSSREQEVNCMVGAGNASTERIEKPEWRYLTRVLVDSGKLTRTDLLARTRGPLKGWTVQLKEVSDDLVANLSTVLANAVGVSA